MTVVSIIQNSFSKAHCNTNALVPNGWNVLSCSLLHVAMLKGLTQKQVAKRVWKNGKKQNKKIENCKIALPF